MDHATKVLHILDHSLPLHSGYTFRTRSIIDEQRKLGYDIALVTSSKHAEHSQFQGDKEQFEDLDFYRTYPGKLSSFPFVNQLDVVYQLYGRLKQVIHQEQPDVLHAHSPCLNGLAALWAGRKFNIPVVYEMRASWEDAAVSHGTCVENDLRYRVSRALETFVLKRVDKITTICEGLKGDIEVRGIPKEKIHVIPNAVNIEQFKPLAEKNQSIVQNLALEGKFVVGFIGSFYEYEGLDLLIKAVSELKYQCPNLVLLLVGGGQAKDTLQQLAQSLGVGQRVHFIGRVNHSEVNNYYSVVDILAYPRLPIRLTELVTPLKPLEAMAMGKPCIASDVGGHKELIGHEVDGFLFKAGSVESLCEHLLALYSREDFCDIIKKGRSKVQNDRNWKTSVSGYLPVYASVTQS